MGGYAMAHQVFHVNYILQGYIRVDMLWNTPMIHMGIYAMKYIMGGYAMEYTMETYRWICYGKHQVCYVNSIPQGYTWVDMLCNTPGIHTGGYAMGYTTETYRWICYVIHQGYI